MTTKKYPSYWLFKTEPEVFSIEDLQELGTEHWDGIRNYQARNLLRDTIQEGDWVLIYHSNTKPIGVAGLAKVTRRGYPDFTAWEAGQKYFDPKSNPENPRWYMVDVTYIETFAHYVPRDDMMQNPALEGMAVLRRGQRLSIQPVSKEHFEIVIKMGGSKKYTV